MRLFRARSKPTRVFPKRFVLSTLRGLGCEVGFSMPVLTAPANSGGPRRALPLRLKVFRGGEAVHQLDAAPDPRAPRTEVWQREWEAGQPAAPAGEDLIAVEYLHEPADGQWLAPIMAKDIEGQFLHRADGRYGAVLTSMVPYRAAGYRFTPIIHLGHYCKFGEAFENATLFLNLKGDGAPTAEGNHMTVSFHDGAGQRLAVGEVAVPFNGAFVYPMEESLAALNVPRTALGDGFTAHFRGGASQFAVFTLTRNRVSGAIGLEHSLPPYYYVTGVTSPAIRGRFYAHALAAS